MYSNSGLYRADIERIAGMAFPWENLRRSSVLITGASGMIGTFLTDVLMERNRSHGDDIHLYAAGRSLERAQARFRGYFGDARFTFIPCDINDALCLTERFDYLFHCASNTHPRAYATDPIGTIMTNVLGTKNVLELAAGNHSRRVVFLSSVEIYGENRGDTGAFREDGCGYIDCNTLRAGYPEGKRTGEALCQAYIQKYGLDVVIPRICRVYGPTMLEDDSKALAQFIQKAVAQEDIVLKSDGTQLFSYCYVGDVVSALLYVLFYGRSGEAYNVADGGSDVRLKDLAAMLAAAAKTNVVFDLPDAVEQKGFSRASVAILNADKLKGLGWRPSGGIGGQVQKTVRILREMKAVGGIPPAR